MPNKDRIEQQEATAMSVLLCSEKEEAHRVQCRLEDSQGSSQRFHKVGERKTNNSLFRPKGQFHASRDGHERGRPESLHERGSVPFSENSIDVVERSNGS